MNTLLPMPAKDTTSRLVAQMPTWAQRLGNSDRVVLDSRGTAHKLQSACFDRPDTNRVGMTSLVDALINAQLCRKCR